MQHSWQDLELCFSYHWTTVKECNLKLCTKAGDFILWNTTHEKLIKIYDETYKSCSLQWWRIAQPEVTNKNNPLGRNIIVYWVKKKWLFYSNNNHRLPKTALRNYVSFGKIKILKKKRHYLHSFKRR